MASSAFENPIHFVTLDVFTIQRFRGNPLAIVEVPRGRNLDQELKHRIAQEFNLSETVFLHPPSSEAEPFNRRCDIFTITGELPFAGHPTIGTLVYLCLDRNEGEPPVQPITLHTKAGPITAKFDSQTGVAEATIPHNVRIHRASVPIQSILDTQPELRKIEAKFEDSYPLLSIVKGMSFVLINVPDVENLAPLVAGGPPIDGNAINWDEGWESFTAPYYYAIVSEDEARRHTHIRSRMIDPSIGEDPATGSAASSLAAYLALQRVIAGATYSFLIEQGVEMGRKSEIGVRVTLNDDGKSVKSVVLTGSAVSVTRGTLTI
ncbi:MAG: hypothetical protein L6R39_001913 [Caloplaca ligustica]|nr:MAG: hypothetical protein L6R39_001913 [Caloplaca ligustica]